jgi:hypothetical protein
MSINRSKPEARSGGGFYRSAQRQQVQAVGMDAMVRISQCAEASSGTKPLMAGPGVEGSGGRVRSMSSIMSW